MEIYFLQAVETCLRTNPSSTVFQYNMTASLPYAFAKTTRNDENNNIEICFDPNDCVTFMKKKGADMVQCFLMCKKWVHTSCTERGKMQM